jgi:nicotinamidase-related amidase
VHGSQTDPQFDSAALITIDTQRDVLDDGPFPIPGTTAALPAMHALLEAFRAAELPIVHVVRIYERDGSNAEPVRRALIDRGAEVLLLGSSGCDLAPDLPPADAPPLDHELLLRGAVQPLGPHEVAIYKPRWGAFYKTRLEQYLRRQRVTTLVFTGCNFPNCPRTSIYEASERDFRVVLARDAISGLYARGERELRGIGVAIMSAERIGKALPGRVVA